MKNDKDHPGRDVFLSVLFLAGVFVFVVLATAINAWFFILAGGCICAFMHFAL